MKLGRNNKVYNIDKLREDKKFVEDRFKYEDGAFGHCISLPSINEIAESHKKHHNNVPLRGVLGYTPYFKEIFDSFETEITGFRLMRRNAHSSYGLHEDTDIGEDVKRVQIPIITNDDCWLAATDLDYIPEDIRLLYEKDGIKNGINWTDEVPYDKDGKSLKDFKERFKGLYTLVQFKPGVMYHVTFAKKIHGLWNDGDTDRVTLLIDVKVNDWLLKFIEGFKDF